MDLLSPFWKNISFMQYTFPEPFVKELPSFFCLFYVMEAISKLLKNLKAHLL